MKYSSSRSKISVNSKNSTIKLNADIEPSLINLNITEKKEEIYHDKKEADILNKKIDFTASKDRSHDASYLEESFNVKRKNNLQAKMLNAQSDHAIKSSTKNENLKTKESRTPIQNTNENVEIINNTYYINSMNTEKFDKSYTSYIINENKKNSINHQNSVNTSINTNFSIKPNANTIQGKVVNLEAKNNLNHGIQEYINNINMKNFERNNEEKNNKNNLKSSADNSNHKNNDDMFVTSTALDGENNKADSSSKRNSNTAINFYGNRKKEYILKSHNENSHLNYRNKKNKEESNFKLREEEIMELNKIIEQEIVKRNQNIEYSGLGSQYNKINSFDLKFNKHLGKVSRVYGKIESRNRFVNKDKYDDLIKEVRDFQSYRNIKLVTEKNNHKFRLLPLINNKRNSFEVLANNFFMNVKTQKESPEYFNIDEEFETYMKNKPESDKYKSIFDEEEQPQA